MQTFLIGGQRARFTIVVLALGLALAGTATVFLTPNSSVAQSPEPQRYTLRDSFSGTTLYIDLGTDPVTRGEFVFSVSGLGMLWGVADVQLAAGGASFSFDGSGAIDQQATIDVVAGLHRASGNLEAETFTLDGALDLVTLIGSAELVHEGTSYQLTSQPPPESADLVLTQVVAAALSQDWAGVYALSTRLVRDSLTEAEFVQLMVDDQVQMGSLVELNVVQDPTYLETGSTGMWWAAALAVMSFDGSGGIVVDAVAPTLVFEEGEWRFVSFERRDPDVMLGEVCSSMQPTLSGSNGDDTLIGTSGDDVIFGLGGKDEIHGGGGNDIICGGPGDDQLFGDAGNDILEGQAGADALDGGDGDDVVFGGPGNDDLTGGLGDDHLEGQHNADVIDGGPGDDKLLGGAGNDTMSAGDGADLLDGGHNADTLDGGDGDDELRGGDGNDTLNGGEGNDVLDGAHNADLLDGGPGNDVLSGGNGNDSLTGGDGDDQLDGGFNSDSCDGGPGIDTGQACEAAVNIP